MHWPKKETIEQQMLNKATCTITQSRYLPCKIKEVTQCCKGSKIARRAPIPLSLNTTEHAGKILIILHTVPRWILCSEEWFIKGLNDQLQFLDYHEFAISLKWIYTLALSQIQTLNFYVTSHHRGCYISLSNSTYPSWFKWLLLCFRQLPAADRLFLLHSE